MPSSSSMPRSSARPWSVSSARRTADGVLALHAMARVEHRVGPRPVVGQQDQALAVLVEPAHRVEPGVTRRARAG